MSDMTPITLIRHGAVALPAGTCYGWHDAEAVAPEQDAQRILAALGAAAGCDWHLVTSPLRRCRALAEALGDQHGLEFTEDPDLREMHFGAWEGRPWTDIPRAELDHWAADWVERAPPGGESLRLLAERASRAIARLAAENKRPLVVITHAGVIRALLCRAQNLSLSEAFHFNVALAAAVHLSP